MGGYRVRGKINGAMTSLLVDTGAAVTLLRKDAWDRVVQATKDPPVLSPCYSLDLVGADGSPPRTYGSASVNLELNGNSLPADVVVVDSLTSEGILGLDVLTKRKATIDLEAEQLYLREQEYLSTGQQHCEAVALVLEQSKAWKCRPTVSWKSWPASTPPRIMVCGY